MTALPTRRGDTPIRAQKVAALHFEVCDTTGRVSALFKGVSGQGEPYGADDVATCGVRLQHGRAGNHERVPDADCTCGFYAYNEAMFWKVYGVLPHFPKRSISASRLVLDVELYGRVLCCEHGWRAERQRVLKAFVPRGLAVLYRRNSEFLGREVMQFRCYACVGPGEPATAWGIVDGWGSRDAYPICDDCAEHRQEGGEDDGWPRSRVVRLGEQPIVPEPMPLDLPSLLGTEVELID